jgi:4-amino-4-deoxy-L-arabinose transferase-like glycosyltransferase
VKTSRLLSSLREQWLEFLFLALLLAAFGATRLVGLGRFVTADEPTWGKLSANFYYALSTGDVSATYQIAHPGVTMLWVGALAYQVKFPEYRHVGQVQIGDTKLFQIFQKHGPPPIELLATARLGMVLVNLLIILVAYLYARRLWGRTAVWVGFLMLIFDPFYTAHSRLFHVDAFLAVFLFASLLAFLWFLRSGKISALLVSGFLAGLSWLTKTPGFLSIAVVAGVSLWAWRAAFAQGEQARPRSFGKGVLFPLAGWLLSGGAVFFLLFPAMWSDPVGTLAKVVGYTLESSQGMHGGAQFVDAFEGGPCSGICYLYFYPYTFLWRSTPVVLSGLILAGVALLKKDDAGESSLDRFALFALLFYGVLFTLVMSLASKKFDRYLLPVYLPLDLLAGWGWVKGAQWLKTIRLSALRRFSSGLVLIGVVALQSILTLHHAPYYLTYFNPWMGGSRRAPQEMMVGWGEGLEQAVLYLKGMPDIQHKRVISWYALSFNWYSLSLGLLADPIPVVRDISQAQLADLQTADYAVVYVNQWQRHMPKAFMDFIEQTNPQQNIWLEGMEYVRIYRLNGSSP